MLEEAVYEMLPARPQLDPEWQDGRVATTQLPFASTVAVHNGRHAADEKSVTRPFFKIALKREVYFDNDVVEGTLTIDSTSEFVIPKLTVAIVCRLIVKDQVMPELKSAHTMYKCSKVCVINSQV
jgi:hypothetical protein